MDYIVKTPTRATWAKLAGDRDFWQDKDTCVRMRGTEYLGYCDQEYYESIGETPISYTKYKELLKRGTMAKEYTFKKSDHGRHVTCKIEDKEIKDARLCFESKYRVYICQDRKNGLGAPDKLGYKYSWVWEAKEGSEGVTEFKFVKTAPTPGRRTFRLLKEIPELKKGALLQEACDDGDQEYVLLDRSHLKFAEDYAVYFDGVPTFSRETVENQPKFFEEVFPVSPSFMNADQLKKHAAFIKRAFKK